MSPSLTKKQNRERSSSGRLNDASVSFIAASDLLYFVVFIVSIRTHYSRCISTCLKDLLSQSMCRLLSKITEEKRTLVELTTVLEKAYTTSYLFISFLRGIKRIKNPVKKGLNLIVDSNPLWLVMTNFFATQTQRWSEMK